VESKASQALTVVRTLKVSFIVAGLLFLYVVFKLPPNVTTHPQPAFELVISAIALTNVVLGFVLPGLKARASRRSRTTAPPTTPIQRWMAGYLFSLALFQSCNLFGVVLHFVGARILVVESLFAAGLLAMLFRNPGAPPTGEGVSDAQAFPEH
jgi:hypothetical protein